MLCQVEAILNSKPLTAVSDHAKESHPLNPAMLLTGFHNHQLFLIFLPKPNIKDEEDSKKTLSIPAQTHKKFLEEMDN